MYDEWLAEEKATKAAQAQSRLKALERMGAIAAVTDLYREIVPAGGDVLDLMSSWVSHLPDEVAYASVIGHGLNGAELAANPRLTRHFVQDLNAEPRLPLDTACVDAALICVSVQYLQQPVAVLIHVQTPQCVVSSILRDIKL